MNQELAREHLIKHARSQNNGRFPEHVSHAAKLTNPMCGDHVELKIYAESGHIKYIGHKTKACAICSASASILCEVASDKPISAVLSMGELFEIAVMQSPEHPWPTQISNLACFEHLRVNPSRRMCALLSWVVLKNALKKGQL